MSLQPFHLAVPVYDVPLARQFYRDIFNLEEGRSAETWVDFNFYGHQLVIHHHPKTAGQEKAATNPVDGCASFWCCLNVGAVGSISATFKGSQYKVPD
jgi:extradiol dioxygenase family protein